MMRRTLLIALMLAIAIGPIQADGMPPDFVDAATVVPALATDIRYAGPHNFTGAPVEGYGAPRCWLTREAASALAKVQADLFAHGLGLEVFDCYRPVRAVQRFVDWSKATDQESGKQEFFPDLPKRDLFKLGYIAARSGHSRGSAVDLTLIDRKSGLALEMGTPFDFFGVRSHPDDPGLPKEVAGHRALLRDAMMRRGFVGYDKEWWHFTLKNEPFPHAAFDVPIR